jgi:hypothetical protein
MAPGEAQEGGESHPTDYDGQAVSSPARKAESHSMHHNPAAVSPPAGQLPSLGDPSHGLTSAEQTLNVRVFLDRSLSSRLSPSRGDGSPYGSPVRAKSLRRSRSREGLNHHGVRVELQKSPTPVRTLSSANEKRYSFPQH